VKNADPISPPMADDPAPASPSPAEGGPGGEIIDIAHARMTSRARGLRLSRELQLHVSVDASGWLRKEVEIVYRREREGTIAPFAVRVGGEAADADLTGPNGIRGRCRQYNTVLRRLYQLAARLATMVRQGRVTLAPGSAIAYAHHELARLDTLIAWRQATYMGHCVVRLGQLGAEIVYFERCDAHLTPIVEQAEQPARKAPPFTPAVPRPRPTRAARWLRWMPWPNRNRAS
jgi:hypothetical protein